VKAATAAGAALSADTALLAIYNSGLVTRGCPRDDDGNDD
jgi:hypothetical protein